MLRKCDTFEVEALRGGERDFHEMRMFKLAISGDVIDNRHFLVVRFGLIGLSPDFCSFRTSVSILPFLGDLEL